MAKRKRSEIEDSNLRALGFQLKIIREANQVSQKVLAKHAGVSREHIARLEKGVYAPTFRTVLAICNVLHCKLGIFLDAQIINDKNDAKNGTTERELFPTE